MSDMSTLANPFNTWSVLARGLADRFAAEVGEERPFPPYTGEILGELAGLATRCKHLGLRLQQLAEHEPKSYDAFLRALEKS